MYYGSIKEGLLSVESQFKRQIVKSSGLSSQKSGKTKQKVTAKKKYKENKNRSYNKIITARETLNVAPLYRALPTRLTDHRVFWCSKNDDQRRK